jgi:diguanylate cyclase (GGDEF)-like protein
MPISLSGSEARVIRLAVQFMRSELSRLKHGISSAIGEEGGYPKRITALESHLDALEKALSKASKIEGPCRVDDTLAASLSLCISRYRRETAIRLETKKLRAVASELTEALDRERRRVDELLSAEWYLSAPRLSMPRLSEFVAQDQAPINTTASQNLGKFDDKFGILRSASNLVQDIRATRQECEGRNAPLAVAFVDVDGLKVLNEAHGETLVDALILPTVMRIVEQVAFGHGMAYRYGGDEFAVLIPSADVAVATAILTRCMHLLRDYRVDSAIELPTLSIGLCVVQPDCPLTEAEALHWAALAKRFAKTSGKNVIAAVVADSTIAYPPEPRLRSGESTVFRLCTVDTE